MLNNSEFCKHFEEELFSSEALPFEEARKTYKNNGVYSIYYNDELIYIGSAKHISDRLVHHKNRNGSALLEKIESNTNQDALSILQNSMFKCVEVPFGRSELEEHLIKKFNPTYNNYKRKVKP